mmetsp:Transcript_43196/g.88393  ORF Transcript_43196/g.88393 Transcript_43196/m.88393 type:complete len:239 (+) Transcript_43196:1910-2626(+)
MFDLVFVVPLDADVVTKLHHHLKRDRGLSHACLVEHHPGAFFQNGCVGVLAASTDERRDLGRKLCPQVVPVEGDHLVQNGVVDLSLGDFRHMELVQDPKHKDRQTQRIETCRKNCPQKSCAGLVVLGADYRQIHQKQILPSDFLTIESFHRDDAEMWVDQKKPKHEEKPEMVSDVLESLRVCLPGDDHDQGRQSEHEGHHQWRHGTSLKHHDVGHAGSDTPNAWQLGPIQPHERRPFP